MEVSAADTVRIMSRRMVEPSYGAMPMPPSEDIHLTPSDLFLISPACMIQNGILLPKPPAGAGGPCLLDTLASSLARALGRYYHFAGRLAIQEHGGGNGGNVTIPLRCTGEGAELIHAVAPSVVLADIVGSVYTPSSLVGAYFPSFNLNVDVRVGSLLPVLWAQVTELSDGVFIGMTMNHAVGDGAGFWELLNAWSAINRGGGVDDAPAPVHQRWFVDTSPVPIPVPLSALQQVFHQPLEELPAPPVREGFFTFSATSVKKLKAKANDEVEMLPLLADGTGGKTKISSLQAVVAHLWRAVARARRVPPEQDTSCNLMIACRGRMRCIPPGYVGNAAMMCMTTGCTIGEILDKGLGWTAWQVNRAVHSFNEEELREWLDVWPREPEFLYPSPSSGSVGGGGGALVVASSPRFNVFGNDFGWGKPVGMRSSNLGKADGLVCAYEGPEREGSISLDVSLAPDTMERLVADHEFMEAVAVPRA